jgi:hypothetical protein
LSYPLALAAKKCRLHAKHIHNRLKTFPTPPPAFEQDALPHGFAPDKSQTLTAIKKPALPQPCITTIKLKDFFETAREPS